MRNLPEGFVVQLWISILVILQAPWACFCSSRPQFDNSLSLFLQWIPHWGNNTWKCFANCSLLWSLWASSLVMFWAKNLERYALESLVLSAVPAAYRPMIVEIWKRRRRKRRRKMKTWKMMKRWGGWKHLEDMSWWSFSSSDQWAPVSKGAKRQVSLLSRQLHSAKGALMVSWI